ncbi:23S rRNA (pseudouridine(1915)-N(3))-methyltransferase RlmH [Aminivibrio sp.]|jgi:23S rRNA (pseudouridine1915-N3)-methyltransferase|uniref:23S rRNA (pseudouridine(1915)-N(3))-methyltransferase RlmH n=1 Tax=Aminivibrio sp. TaxID=1872489 RepID=UPI001A4B786E|nr:23S rRNA (pseudouridine(1915)-N(3))-methyltransferase RlmH [Aminivibrio sp.]MBL3539261.1 23S rRNA (pseudouridine(1915)-N(3))-methyltransferase RlmH [Aminivibrio sp.]MDK2958274.1 rRNA (pseudouridine1915-N3)-methyltransferase [Synergistaceae bacterium]
MKIIILSVGKTRDGHFAALADRYFERISPFLKAGIEVAPESKDGNAARKVEREGKEILKKIRERDYVVILDEGGEETDSFSFARWLSAKLDESGGRIVFVIGGAFGLAGEVKERADHSLSLSKMTMPHELCRVFLAEQLYRACTILRGVDYSH